MDDLNVVDFNKEENETKTEVTEVLREENGTEKKEKKEEPHSALRELLSWVLTFAVAIVAALFIKYCLIINADVPTGSMENTIMPGDRLIGNRLAYLKEGPQRGDIVVFHYPDNEKALFVKRVIGLPGESVHIEDAKVYIDGVELEEPYLKEEWTIATGTYDFEVPEDCYLMLGDNRNNSKDARYWENKYVNIDKILGKALFIYWPFSDFGSLND
uniref:signal peptidase I n=1 Tax=Roseburia sp. TaxID=2049040 RepID=UPI003FED97E3